MRIHSFFILYSYVETLNIDFYGNVILTRQQQSDEFNFINFSQEEILDGVLS